MRASDARAISEAATSEAAISSKVYSYIEIACKNGSHSVRVDVPGNRHVCRVVERLISDGYTVASKYSGRDRALYISWE